MNVKGSACFRKTENARQTIPANKTKGYSQADTENDFPPIAITTEYMKEYSSQCYLSKFSISKQFYNRVHNII